MLAEQVGFTGVILGLMALQSNYLPKSSLLALYPIFLALLGFRFVGLLFTRQNFSFYLFGASQCCQVVLFKLILSACLLLHSLFYVLGLCLLVDETAAGLEVGFTRFTACCWCS